MPIIPQMLILEVTHSCNYCCPFCYCLWNERQNGDFSNGDLSTDEWCGIIREAASCGVQEFLFTGGEPLLRGDILELLECACGVVAPENVLMFTNGALLDREKILWMKKHGVRLATSLQGLKTYSDMTGTGLTAPAFLDKVALARDLEWPMTVSLTVNSINANELCDMFKAAAKAGACSIQVSPVMLEGRVTSNRDLLITQRRWEELKNDIRTMPSCEVPYSFCDEMICTCKEMPADCDDYSLKEPSPCMAEFAFAVIGANGKYRKCIHHPVEREIPWHAQMACT